MTTQMIYTTSLRQINYIASWMQDYITSFEESYMNRNSNFHYSFDSKLVESMVDFLNNLLT